MEQLRKNTLVYYPLAYVAGRLSAPAPRLKILRSENLPSSFASAH